MTGRNRSFAPRVRRVGSVGRARGRSRVSGGGGGEAADSTASEERAAGSVALKKSTSEAQLRLLGETLLP